MNKFLTVFTLFLILSSCGPTNTDICLIKCNADCNNKKDVDCGDDLDSYCDSQCDVASIENKNSE